MIQAEQQEEIKMIRSTESSHYFTILIAIFFFLFTSIEPLSQIVI